jgi:O-antigen/teichoic acid export membrane protein
MTSVAKEFLRRFGVDRAIFYTLVNRGFSAFTGPVSISLIYLKLTDAEQGYYFTFTSILGLQIIFELGLGYVIMQCASHEKAHLEWTSAGTLEGDPLAKARLASLFRFAFKCYLLIAVLAACVLIPAGIVFFSKGQAVPAATALDKVPVAWLVPWVLVVVVTCFNLFLTPFYSLLEGCGKVAEFARRGAWMSIIGNSCFWLALLANGKLFAAPVQSATIAVMGALWVFVKYRACFKDIMATPIPPGAAVKWKEEILPFQWKIALSAFSGYFIFQLAIPVLFRYCGPAEAGRMGMSMKIFDTLTNLAFSWISTKAAPFGTYISRKDFKTLDEVFKKASRQAVGVLLLGGAAFFAAYYILIMAGVPLTGRFLGPLALLFLFGSAVINCIVFCQAIYLRAHKQEPFLINSLAGAVIVPLIIFFLGRPYGGFGIAAGLFFSGLFIGLPWATWVFLKKRKQWHKL